MDNAPWILLVLLLLLLLTSFRNTFTFVVLLYTNVSNIRYARLFYCDTSHQRAGDAVLLASSWSNKNRSQIVDVVVALLYHSSLENMELERRLNITCSSCGTSAAASLTLTRYFLPGSSSCAQSSWLCAAYQSLWHIWVPRRRR